MAVTSVPPGERRLMRRADRCGLGQRVQALRELADLWTVGRAGWSAGRRPWLAGGLTAGAVTLTVMSNWTPTSRWVERVSAVSASERPFAELGRLPLSALVPTPDLPLWLAAGQILLVIGLAELALPRRWLVLVGAAGHALPTLAARWMITVGPGHVLGLPQALATVIDTGPSAMTTAVGAWLLLTVGARRILLLLSVALLWAERWSPGLDGREHLLALGVGVCAGVITLATRRTRATADLSVRRVTLALGLALMAFIGMSAYRPLGAAAAAPPLGPAGAAVRLVNRAQVPIRLTRVPAGDWLSRDATCTSVLPRSRWVWQRPVYLCERPTAGDRSRIRLHMQVAGIPIDQNIRARRA